VCEGAGTIFMSVLEGGMKVPALLLELEPLDAERAFEARGILLLCAAVVVFAAAPLLSSPPMRETLAACATVPLLLIVFFTHRRITPLSLKWFALFIPAVPLVVLALTGGSASVAFWLFGFLLFLSCAKLAHERDIWGYGLFLVLLLGASAAALVEMFHIALQAETLRPYGNLCDMAALATPALVGSFSLFVNHPLMGRTQRYTTLHFGLIFGLMCVLALGVASSRSLGAFLALSAGAFLVLCLRWEAFSVVAASGMVAVVGLLFGWAVLAPNSFAASQFGLRLRLWGEVLAAGGFWLPAGRGAGAFPIEAPSLLDQATRSHPLAPDGLWSAPSVAAKLLYENGLFVLGGAFTLAVILLLLSRTRKGASTRALFREMVLPCPVTAVVLLFLSEGPISPGVWPFYCGLFGLGLGLSGREEPLLHDVGKRGLWRLLMCGIAVYLCGFVLVTHHIRGVLFRERLEEARRLYEEAHASAAARKGWSAAMVAPTRVARFEALYDTARMARDGQMRDLAATAIWWALRLNPYSARAHLVAATLARENRQKASHLAAVLRYGVFRPCHTDIEHLQLLADQLERLGRQVEAQNARRWAEKIKEFLSSP